MLGTTWVRRGRGATVGELRRAYRHTTRLPKPLRKQVRVKLAVLSILRGPEHRTNLKLTGTALTEHDMERITDCR
jgi:hypothetical protein